MEGWREEGEKAGYLQLRNQATLFSISPPPLSQEHQAVLRVLCASLPACPWMTFHQPAQPCPDLSPEGKSLLGGEGVWLRLCVSPWTHLTGGCSM